MISGNLLKPIQDYILVGVIGLATLLISYQGNYLGLTWSDEIVYATIARNLIVDQSLNTNYYRTDSIIRRGFPTRDVHVPGHMLAIALSFAVFGVSDAAAILPSQVSYVAAGLILFAVGSRLFTRRVAWIATIFFFIYPINFVFANMAMSELPLTLLVVLFLWFWVKIYQTPHWSDALSLALVLIVGSLYRETFLIFVLPAFYLIWRWSRQSHSSQPVWLFGLSFVVLMGSVVYPLGQNRSFYPNLFNVTLETEGLPGLWWLMVLAGINKTLTFKGFFPSESLGEVPARYLVSIFHLVLGLIVFIGLYLFNKSSQKWFVWLFVFIWWSTVWLLNGWYYPPHKWESIRSLAVLTPAGFLIVAALIISLKSIWMQRVIIGLLLVFLSSSSFLTQIDWRDQRQLLFAREVRISAFIKTHVGHLDPQTILGSQFFLYGWQYYPTTIIWSLPSDRDTAEKLLQKVPEIDAVVIDTSQERTQVSLPLQDFLQIKGYRLVGVDDNLWIFAR